MTQLLFLFPHPQRRLARLLLLSEVSTWLPHDGIRRERVEPSKPRGRERRTIFLGLTRSRRPRGTPPPLGEEVQLVEILLNQAAAALQRKICVIPPHAMKDDGEFAGDCHYRLLHSTPAGNRDAPGFKWIPTTGAG